MPDEEREERYRAAVRGAERFLNAWHGSPGPRGSMLEVAGATAEDERWDRYGSGERIERLSAPDCHDLSANRRPAARCAR